MARSLSLASSSSGHKTKMPGLLREFVTVIVGGYQLSGFQEVDVRFSLKEAAVGGSLKSTWPSNSQPAKALRRGDQIEVRSQAVAEGQPPTPGGGDLICMGAVDAYEADIGEGPHKTVSLRFRSNSRDIIDCMPVDHPTGRVENRDFVGVAQDLGREFGIRFWTDLSGLPKLPQVQRIPGETLFATLDRIARHEGLLMVGQPDSSVKVTRAGATGERHAGALIEGQPPIDRVSVRVAAERERSKITTKAQRRYGADADDLQQRDDYVTGKGNGRARHHEAIVETDPSSKTKLRTRGKWHHLRSFGDGMQVAPRVSRWRDEGGTLWTPGLLVAVRIPSEDIDMDMLLSEVTLKQGLGPDGGTRAELVLTDPRDYGGDKPMGPGEPDEIDPGDGIDVGGGGDF
jgi:prophage tail gpP-like protein